MHGVRTCRTPACWAPSSSPTSRARTGAATSTNPQLTRIYGTAWATKDDLEAHLHRLRKPSGATTASSALELDLFSFPDEIGSGLAVFHPKGGLIRRLMEDYSRRRHEEAGYEFVNSPHITKSDLFETSGHLEWFADGMFPPMELDGGTRVLPQAHELPDAHPDLPQPHPELPRAAAAPVRVRHGLPLREVGRGPRAHAGARTDDGRRAHLHAPREQMGEELRSLLVFVLDLLRDYGLDEFYLELSTRPEDKAVGSDEEWAEATEALRQAAESMDLELVMDEGGGAFYGPKISVQARDAIGRTWQMSTIQVDFQMPQRFDLHYAGADGERHRPIMIHRALFGSVERFFGVLTEHYAGAFPLWLVARAAPVRRRSPTATSSTARSSPTKAKAAGPARAWSTIRRNRSARRSAPRS